MALLLAVPQAAVAHGDEVHEDASEATEDTGVEPLAGGASEVSVPAVTAPIQPVEHEDARGPSIASLLTNLHPATVHFAIALFLVAGLVEGIAVFRPSARLFAATDIMLVAGGVGAMIAAIFGWIHTGLWLGGDSTMQVHRWVGTGLAVVGVGLSVLGWKSPESRNLLRALLVFVVIAVLVQGYLGGELGHGAGHLWATAH